MFKLKTIVFSILVTSLIFASCKKETTEEETEELPIGWEYKSSVIVLDSSIVDSIVVLEPNKVELFSPYPDSIIKMLKVDDTIFSPVYAGVMGVVQDIYMGYNGKSVIINTQTVPITTFFKWFHAVSNGRATYVMSEELKKQSIIIKDKKLSEIVCTVGNTDFVAYPVIKELKFYVNDSVKGYENYTLPLTFTIKTEVSVSPGGNSSSPVELKVAYEEKYDMLFGLEVENELELDAISGIRKFKMVFTPYKRIKSERSLIFSLGIEDTTLTDSLLKILSKKLNKKIDSLMDIYSIRATWILPPLGIIPVTANVRVGVFANIGLSLEGGIEITQMSFDSSSTSVGFYYANGEFREIKNEYHKKITFPIFLEAYAEGKLELFVGLKLKGSVLLADCLGPSLTIKAGPYGEFGVRLTSFTAPELSYELGMKVNAALGLDFQVPVIGIGTGLDVLEIEARYKIIDGQIYLLECPDKSHLKGGCYYVNADLYNSGL